MKILVKFLKALATKELCKSISRRSTEQMTKLLPIFYSFSRLALCDLAGAAQTIAAHEAIKKAVRLDGKGDLDAAERYLWALSAGAQPKEDILKGEFLLLCYVLDPYKVA